VATALCELSEKLPALATLDFPRNTFAAFAGRGSRHIPIFLQSLLLSEKSSNTGKLDEALGTPFHLACFVAKPPYSNHRDSPFFAWQWVDSERVAIQFSTALAWAWADSASGSSSCHSSHYFGFAACSIGLVVEIVRDFKLPSCRIPISS
jgi:hypothetical protein